MSRPVLPLPTDIIQYHVVPYIRTRCYLCRTVLTAHNRKRVVFYVTVFDDDYGLHDDAPVVVCPRCYSACTVVAADAEGCEYVIKNSVEEL